MVLKITILHLAERAQGFSKVSVLARPKTIGILKRILKSSSLHSKVLNLTVQVELGQGTA